MSKNSFTDEVAGLVRSFAIGAVGAYLINSLLLVNARVPSESMEKTLMIGDRFFANRLAYENKEPKRNDIILFTHPSVDPKKPEEMYVKRIVGVPGDMVETRDGEKEVPVDAYYVLGDNRDHSFDSRKWEDPFVKREEIIGKAAFRYWPINRRGIIE